MVSKSSVGPDRLLRIYVCMHDCLDSFELFVFFKAAIRHRVSLDEVFIPSLVTACGRRRMVRIHPSSCPKAVMFLQIYIGLKTFIYTEKTAYVCVCMYVHMHACRYLSINYMQKCSVYVSLSLFQNLTE